MTMGLDQSAQVADEIKLLAYQLLEETIALNVGLSENESDYDLIYIGQRLAQCSSYMEKLSSIQLRLTKLTLQVIDRVYAAKGLQYVADQEQYEDSTLIQKNVLIWENAAKIVREVKEAVESKAAMVKRLDSDLRLHQKLLEAKVAAGADSNVSFGSGSGKELDL